MTLANKYRPTTFDDGMIGQKHIVDIILRKKIGDKLPHYQTKSDICGWVLTSGSTPEDALRYSNDAWELLKKYIIIKCHLNKYNNIFNIIFLILFFMCKTQPYLFASFSINILTNI